MKIAYIGIDLLISALFSLMENGCEIAEIFTCKTDNKTEFNTQIIETALKHNIPISVKKVTLSDLERMADMGCDAVICAGYYYKLPVCPRIPMVNIHPAYLPVGKGSWPMPIAILRRMEASGVTIHKIAESFDAGDILLQTRFSLSENESLVSLMDKVNLVIKALIPILMHSFSTLYENALPQGEGEYWQAPTAEDWTVTHDMDAEAADRIFRAFLGYECIYRTAEGDSFELIGGKICFEKPQSNHFFVMDNGVYITADKITELKS